MTSFFQQQDDARRHTGRLVILFVLAVAGLIACRLPADGRRPGLFRREESAPAASSRPCSGTRAALPGRRRGDVAVVGVASVFKVAWLASGGKAVAADAGRPGTPARTPTTAEKRLLNVVEEMAIASGVPVPPVYLLEQEDGINAFAAGYTPGDAVIGVSARLHLEYLNRDELQGVVAHEFSHILNGDMRLNLRLMADPVRHPRPDAHRPGADASSGRIGLRRAVRKKDDGGGRRPCSLVGLGALRPRHRRGVLRQPDQGGRVAGSASTWPTPVAVQFTRNPDGIAGALKKIGGLAEGSTHRRARRPAEASHLFFATALNEMFATHPPLEERDRARRSELGRPVAERAEVDRRRRRGQASRRLRPGSPAD